MKPGAAAALLEMEEKAGLDEGTPSEEYQARQRAAESPVVDPDWKMPAIEPGMLVRWNPAQKSDIWFPAIVTQVHSHSLKLNVIVPDAFNTQPKDNVYHDDDPNEVRIANLNAGTWDYHPFHVKLFDLIDTMTETANANAAAMAAMGERLLALEQRVGGIMQGKNETKQGKSETEKGKNETEKPKEN